MQDFCGASAARLSQPAVLLIRKEREKKRLTKAGNVPFPGSKYKDKCVCSVDHKASLPLADCVGYGPGCMKGALG